MPILVDVDRGDIGEPTKHLSDDALLEGCCSPAWIQVHTIEVQTLLPKKLRDTVAGKRLPQPPCAKDG